MMAAMLATAGAAASGDHRSDLDAIRHPDCALAIWQRPLPDKLAALIDALDVDGIADVDAKVPVVQATMHAAVLLGAAGYEGDTAIALATEIGEMAALLALIVAAERLRVRLEVVDTDACRRFHADMVTVRLLATLRGPGTQWIETGRPDAIEDIQTGAVALFKGRLLIEEPRILHRSPPIGGLGIRRLVLVIDQL